MEEQGKEQYLLIKRREFKKAGYKTKDIRIRKRYFFLKNKTVDLDD